MRLELNQFGGMAPLVDPTALADRLATFAKNVRFDRGVLSPGALKLEVTSDYPDVSLGSAGIESVAKLLESGTRFAFSHPDGDQAFASPVAPTDTWGRVYFMTAAGPSFTSSDSYTAGELNVNPVNFRLGVPAPASPLSVAQSNVAFTESDPPSDKATVAYVYSFVDRYGHEGAFSVASAKVDLPIGVAFTATVTIPSERPARVDFSGGAVRIYRATFDGSSSAWQYLKDVAISAASFTDDVPVGEEGEVAISESWYPAPDDLEQLCLVASSFAAGLKSHYVCFSELKLPHAWPFELQYPLRYSPVKLVPMVNGLLIATTGKPYWSQGADPFSAIPQELGINAPCVSAESVVDMGGRAFYLTQEGIVSVSPTDVELLTETFIDRAGMEAMAGPGCKAFAFDNRYVFSTLDDRWMMFDPSAGFIEVDFGFAPSVFASVSLSVRDNVYYFAFASGGVRTIDFDGGATGVEWHSKHWRTPPAGFSCVRVDADIYPVTVVVRLRYPGEDWVDMAPTVVEGPHIHRLEPRVGMLWQVQVTPPELGSVYRVILAQSGLEAA